MKFLDHSSHSHFGWGVLVAAFGVFFLIANLVPCGSCMLKFWPIFLILAGAYKALGGCCKHNQK